MLFTLKRLWLTCQNLFDSFASFSMKYRNEMKYHKFRGRVWYQNKGGISINDNSRGITLPSISSKIFCRVTLKRIRDEQAGFRAGRGCSDQIFALRNIVELCIEWNALLMRHYGLLQKNVSLIKLFSERFESGVILK